MWQEIIKAAPVISFVIAFASLVVAGTSLIVTFRNNRRVAENARNTAENTNRIAEQERERKKEKDLWEQSQAARQQRERHARELEPRLLALSNGLTKVNDFLSTGPDTTPETVNRSISEIFYAIGKMPGENDIYTRKHLRPEHLKELMLFKELLMVLTVDFSRNSKRRESGDYLDKMRLNRRVLDLTIKRLAHLCYIYGVGPKTRKIHPVAAVSLIIDGAETSDIEAAIARSEEELADVEHVEAHETNGANAATRYSQSD